MGEEKEKKQELEEKQCEENDGRASTERDRWRLRGRPLVEMGGRGVEGQVAPGPE